MQKFFEHLVVSAWNWLRGRRNRPLKESTGSLTLGLRVVEGEVTKARITASQVRRANHTAAIGRTGSGKSFWIKYCMAQDVAAGRGGFVIDFHDDLTPFLLGTLAAKEGAGRRNSTNG